jgi:8-oxo-dGTP pyrophosphatase MutT (NUDIX family)
MGAGLIPFCVNERKVHYLFHKTFSGRRAGYLVDFGGGSQDGETYRQTAVREFVEETDTMFLGFDLSRDRRTSARIAAQIPVMDKLLARTLDAHPDWWCQRAPGSKTPPKDWRSFFVEVEHRDVNRINAQWAGDDGSRFKKPRELLWVPGDELKAIIDTAPDQLWKRVRQLIGARETVEAILAAKESSRQVSDSSVETSKSGS